MLLLARAKHGISYSAELGLQTCGVALSCVTDARSVSIFSTCGLCSIPKSFCALNRFSIFVVVDSVIPFREVAVLDKNAEFLGVPKSSLMENAGKKVYEKIVEKFDVRGKKVIVFCGMGNNGGDGFVAARYLKEASEVAVVLAGRVDRIRSELALRNFEKLEGLGVRTFFGADHEYKEFLSEADLVVDAIFGVGVKGEIREPYASLIKAINESGKTIVSIDVPSGLGSKTPIRPSMTITLHDIKEGMTAENSGEIIVVDIGIPKEAETHTGPGLMAYFPVPAPDSHKGMNGMVLVVGGGPYSGAPALAGFAAYRTGVDIVRIATPSNTYPIIAGFSPNFIVTPLIRNVLTAEDLDKVASLCRKVNTVIIGPGLGNLPQTKKAVQDIVRERTENTFVIDADAIEAVADDLSCLRGRRGVITPHLGEFQKLLGKSPGKSPEERAKQAMELANKTGFTILLKGKTDIITDGKRVKYNKTGNAGMTVGGTGDVLTGIVAGLLSKGVSPFYAACLGAFINGYSGDLAFKEFGYSLLATDVIEMVPKTIMRFLACAKE